MIRTIYENAVIKYEKRLEAVGDIVLGAIISSPDALDDYYEDLWEKDFVTDRQKILFRIIVLFKEDGVKVNKENLEEFLEQNGLLDVFENYDGYYLEEIIKRAKVYLIETKENADAIVRKDETMHPDEETNTEDTWSKDVDNSFDLDRLVAILDNYHYFSDLLGLRPYKEDDEMIEELSK